MDRMVNNNWLTLILVCMLRTYRTYNSIVKILKYEFNNKLLGGVTLFRVIPGVTWTQSNIYKYIYIYIYVCVCVCVCMYASKFKYFEK